MQAGSTPPDRPPPPDQNFLPGARQDNKTQDAARTARTRESSTAAARTNSIFSPYSFSATEYTTKYL